MRNYVFNFYVSCQETRRVYVPADSLIDAWTRAAAIACKIYGVSLDKIELVTIIEN